MEQGDRVGIWGPNSYEWYQTQVCPSCSVFTSVLNTNRSVNLESKFQTFHLNEIIIEITDVSPRDFFGQNNETVALLKEHFPKLKIIARGSKIKAYGSESELNDFEQKFDKLTAHFAKYNKIDPAAAAALPLPAHVDICEECRQDAAYDVLRGHFQPPPVHPV